jgi:CheY-like chemotaxis protein
MFFDNASELIARLGRDASALVLLAEYGETTALPDLRVIAMPAHPISIANILNGKEDESYYRKDAIGLYYAAPEARLLIVDDIPTNLRVAKGLVAPLGAATDTCLSGAEAVELVQARDYDIVFMDHMMPEMDGIEATAAIRALGGEKYERLPIVALTANAIGGMREMLLASGFNDYIAKPIETAKLYDVIDRWIPKEKRVVSERNTEPLPEEANRDKIIIDGLDTDLAVMLVGGKIKDYISVLTLFCEDAKEKFKALERPPEEGGDLKPFTMQVHALKSVLATIGAAEASKKAAALEEAARGADFETIRRALPDFRENLSDLAAKVTEALPKREENSAAKALSQDILTELSLAFESKDGIKADRIIDSLDLGEYDERTVTALNEMENAVLLFDFEKAEAALDSLRTEA